MDKVVPAERAEVRAVPAAAKADRAAKAADRTARGAVEKAAVQTVAKADPGRVADRVVPKVADPVVQKVVARKPAEKAEVVNKAEAGVDPAAQVVAAVRQAVANKAAVSRAVIVPAVRRAGEVLVARGQPGEAGRAVGVGEVLAEVVLRAAVVPAAAVLPVVAPVVEVAAVARNQTNHDLFRLQTQMSARRGVTLLELLLALALSVVVLATIGMAINVHFKMLDVRRTSLEEMQVVRVVTLRMTNDIRMLVQPNKPDLSGLETVLQNSAAALAAQANAAAGSVTTIGGTGNNNGSGGGAGGAGGGGQGQGGQSSGNQGGQGGQGGGGGGQGGGQGGQGGGQTGGQSGGQGQSGGNAGRGGGTGGQTRGGGGSQAGKTGGGTQSTSGTGSQAASATGSSSSSTSSSSSSAESTAAPAVQLIGSAYELRFDVSRLPRVDQYQGIISSSGELSATDLPSDVKTIAYFIRSQQSAESYAGDPQAAGGETSTDGYGRGLMRAELDRAVTSYAETGGSTDAIYSTAQLLANEVVGLGFQYFDGVDWVYDWDSTSSGTLPRAIKIWLSVQPTYGMNEQEIADAVAAGKMPPEQEFYFTIMLPTVPLVAAPPTTETATDTAAASSSTSTTQSSGTTTQGTMP